MNFNNKNILITGGTGSFGNKLVETLLNNYAPNKVIVLSRDEFKQDVMNKKFRDNRLRFFLGDVRDYNRLEIAFKDIDVIFHAAALKQVPALEYNPEEAIKTNILGSQNVINAAIKNKVSKVIAISTDKAVSPVNLYGATKMCMERLFIASNNIVGDQPTVFSVVRYGNVLGSRGSVIPLFLEQEKTGEFTVTDERMTRFNFSLDNAIKFVVKCSQLAVGGEIFVPKLFSYNIMQLCKVINPDANIKVIGLRPGEKINECMINELEAGYCYTCDDFYIIFKDDEKLNHNSKYFFGDLSENYKNLNVTKTENLEKYESGGDIIDNIELARLIKLYVMEANN